MINNFWGDVRTPITTTNPCVEIGIINQLTRFNNDQGFGITLSNRSIRWDLYLS